MKWPNSIIVTLLAFAERHRKQQRERRQRQRWEQARRTWTLTMRSGTLYLARNGEPVCEAPSDKEQLYSFLIECWAQRATHEQ
jgi:hypothetical protein